MTDPKPILEQIASDAMRRAADQGIRAAVCIVTIADDTAMAHVSPFQATGIEAVAVAQQLRAQSRVLMRQAAAPGPGMR